MPNGEPTPRERKVAFAGTKRRARRKKPPPKKPQPTRSRTVLKFKTTGLETIADEIEAADGFRRIRNIPWGSRIRITARGKAGKTKIDPKVRRREYVMGYGVRGNRLAHMNQLLHHSLGVLGPEFFSDRGRGYDLLDPADKIEWRVEVLAPERPERKAKRKSKRKAKRKSKRKQ